MKKVRSCLIGFLLVNLLWLAASALLGFRAFPGPAAVYAHFGQMISAGLLRHIFASLYRVLAGLLLSLAIGLPLGLSMAKEGEINRLLRPLVYFGYPVPKTALLPVAMLLSGLGERSKILIMTLTTVFPMILSVRDKACSIDPAFYRVARSAGASGPAIFRHITLPALLPGLFTSLRVGTGTSLAILLIVEAYGTRRGIGYFILDAWSRIDYLSMYGGITVLSAVGAALFLLLDLSEQQICRWNQQDYS